MRLSMKQRAVAAILAPVIPIICLASLRSRADGPNTAVPGVYGPHHCLDGTLDPDPSVYCALWNPAWCSYAGQECNRCDPNPPDQRHQICKSSPNQADKCRSFGFGPWCGKKANRRCTPIPNTDPPQFTCDFQSYIYPEELCGRWKCEDVVVGTQDE